MDKLILKFDDRVIKEYLITKNLIKIGRESDNDIVVDSAGLSRNHAKIEEIGGNYVLSDLDSTNGTFVNKKKIKQVKLNHSDEIIVGKHLIIFQSEQKEEAKPNMADFESTMVLNTKQQKELFDLQAKKSSQKHDEKTAKLIVIQSEIRKEYKLTKDETVIGKSPNSDVTLKGFLVPQLAAKIKKEDDSFYIIGYGGWISINVNGKKVEGNWKLYTNDVIKIRNIKIIFQLEMGLDNLIPK